MLVTIVFFILLLGLLVLAHEWGHFFVARRLGVKVEEFAFGFPPRLASFVSKGTRYAFNLFPLGGYVKIFGESGEGKSDPESFSSRTVGQRFYIIVAGVAMNIVLAWVLFSVGHGLGLPTVIGEGDRAENARVTIIGVSPGSPAEKSGLAFGDAITGFKVDNAELAVATVDDVQKLIASRRGGEIAIIVGRGSEEVEIKVVPRVMPPQGEGPLGIAMARVGIVRAPLLRAPLDGLRTTANAVLAITSALGHMARDFVSTGRVSGDVSGPVGIFVFADQTRRLGLTYLLELAGILSVNLALLNILPIPALDGGRILFLAIERVRGVGVNQRFEQLIHTLGFAILLILMAAITYRDIIRIF